jgi:hypothetical protein
MSPPTVSEQYAQLMEHIRKAQENAAMIAHLHNENGDAPGMVLGRAWLHVEDNLNKMASMITNLAQGRLQ